MAEPAALMQARREYEALAGDYDARWRAYVAATTERTLAALPPLGRARVLDVGCGTGVLLERLAAREPGVRCAGVDVAPAMLRAARARLPAGVPLAVAEAGALPFARGSFDAVVSNSSLHYWPDAERGLREMVRVLRPGGTLVLTDWCDDFLAIRLLRRWLRLRGAAVSRVYGAAELCALLGSLGVRARAQRYRVGLRWGMMTLAGRAGDG